MDDIFSDNLRDLSRNYTAENRLIISLLTEIGENHFLISRLNKEILQLTVNQALDPFSSYLAYLNELKLEEIRRALNRLFTLQSNVNILLHPNLPYLSRRQSRVALESHPPTCRLLDQTQRPVWIPGLPSQPPPTTFRTLNREEIDRDCPAYQNRPSNFGPIKRNRK